MLIFEIGPNGSFTGLSFSASDSEASSQIRPSTTLLLTAQLPILRCPEI